MSDDVKRRLKQVLVNALKLAIPPEAIPDSGLTVELGLDSINSLEYLVWVENEFDIEIADEDLSVALVDSLDRLAAYVVERQRHKAAATATTRPDTTPAV